jgi:hypothetical protein
VCLTGLTGVEPLSESCPVSPVGTGLTGGAHRSDRCWSEDSRFGVPLRSRVGRVCVLVPRSSGTPVATWAWPTWVVSWRRALEAVFILLELPSPSRRIFIGSHSLPPLWFAVSVLHCTRHQFVPSLYSGHVITYSRMFPFPSANQPFCQMMVCSRPQASLPNALRKISC